MVDDPGVVDDPSPADSIRKLKEGVERLRSREEGKPVVVDEREAAAVAVEQGKLSREEANGVLFPFLSELRDYGHTALLMQQVDLLRTEIRAVLENAESEIDWDDERLKLPITIRIEDKCVCFDRRGDYTISNAYGA